jgi:hypothetical protein
MRHYYRTHVSPSQVLDAADSFFPALGLPSSAPVENVRAYQGSLGTLRIEAVSEGGHYTRIEALTDQVGESRLDRNVKRFFVVVHRSADPSHRLKAAY